MGFQRGWLPMARVVVSIHCSILVWGASGKYLFAWFTFPILLIRPCIAQLTKVQFLLFNLHSSKVKNVESSIKHIFFHNRGICKPHDLSCAQVFQGLGKDLKTSWVERVIRVGGTTQFIKSAYGKYKERLTHQSVLFRSHPATRHHCCHHCLNTIRLQAAHSHPFQLHILPSPIRIQHSPQTRVQLVLTHSCVFPSPIPVIKHLPPCGLNPRIWTFSAHLKSTSESTPCPYCEYSILTLFTDQLPTIPYSNRRAHTTGTTTPSRLDPPSMDLIERIIDAERTLA